MAYIDTQRRRLGEGERFAVKIQNRDSNASGETHWINASADQVKRIMEILSEDDRYYTLTQEDVGKPTLRAFGQSWPVVDFIGRVLPRDVGKRVVKVRDDADVADFLQVESAKQRDERLGK